MEDVTINGWLARDKNGGLYLYEKEPFRDNGAWRCWYGYREIPEMLYPDLTWESDPKEVEITIKIKE